MRKAAIDVGTNSFLLTIAEVESGKVKHVHEDQLRIVRLGQGLDQKGSLHPNAIKRALQAFQEFAEICERYQIEPSSVNAGGTSALREASDSLSFRQKVEEQTGFRLRVISGEDEGKLSWLGATSSLPFQGSNPCLIDIGGGSTELIWNDGSQSHSMPMGVVRAKERLIKNDPPSSQECQDIDNSIRELASQLPTLPKASPLIAVAGTATTIAAVAGQIEPYDGEKVHGTTLSLQQLQTQMEQYRACSLEERREIKGLAPARADLICGGAQILLTVFELLEVEECLISDRGIRYGLLLEG